MVNPDSGSEGGVAVRGGRMPGFQGWFRTLFELLDVGEELCLHLIRTYGGRGGTVELVEGEATSLDALTYARVLLELGRPVEAEEVLRAVLGAELGVA